MRSQLHQNMVLNSLDPAHYPDLPDPTETISSLEPINKQQIKKWLVGLLSLFLLGGISYIAYRQLVMSPPQAAQGITIVPVERTNLSLTVSANGTVDPERVINVSPKNAGIMTRLLVKEGDFVSAGQVLAHMDDSNLQGQLMQEQGRLAQAEANLRKLIAGNRPQDIAQAQARVEELEAKLRKLKAGNRPQDIAQAQARLDSARANLSKAEDDFRRNQQLSDAGAIPLLTLNQKRADRDRAQAEVEEAQQALSLQKAGTRTEDIDQAHAEVKQQQQVLDLLKAGTRTEDIDQARAEVKAARGSLSSIQTQINDTLIRAPFNGVVLRKYADPGAFVTPMTAGSSVSSATSSSILSLASTNQVVANVAESNIAKISVGQEAIVKADAYPGKTFQGKVTQISTQAIVQQNVTSFEVEVALLAGADKQLRSGMNVSVEFQVGTVQNALTVPTVAVTRQKNVTGVFVGAPNQPPRFIAIATGATVNNRTEVKSGLNGTEHILINVPPQGQPPPGFSLRGLFGGGPPGGGPPSGGPPGGGPPSGGPPSGGPPPN